MEDPSFDVVIVGAGASGLIAAWEIAQTGKTVAVVEAKEHVGGRVHTILDTGFDLPVELGAEFIHGNLELTGMILKKAKIDKYKLKGSIWQNKNGALKEQSDFIEDFADLNKKLKKLKEDISVADFIKNYLQEDRYKELRFTLKNYVEGYYAADTNKASTFSLREELNTSDDVQYRIEGGYGKLIQYLHSQCIEKNVQFFLSHIAKEIKWKKNKVEAVTNQKKITGKKILITVAVGVLQSENIRFSPSINEKIAAAKQLGYGPVIKTLLQFDEPFWKNQKYTQKKDLNQLSFIFSGAVIPTWWTYFPKDAAMITGWSGGPHAIKIKNLSDKEILQKALESLSKIFTIDMASLKNKLKAWHVANWINEPFSCGAYSYEALNGRQLQQIIKQPLENTVFFSGEGLHEGVEIGTVEAALKTGRNAAHQIVAGFKN